MKWDAQQAIVVDCPDDEAAELVLDQRLGLSYAALEMGVRRINLKVRGEMFLPLSPHLTVAFGTDGRVFPGGVSQPMETAPEPDLGHVVTQWLNKAGETQKLQVSRTADSITVRCGDILQASQLWEERALLERTKVKTFTLYVGKSLYKTTRMSEPCLKDDRHVLFCHALLLAHREILESCKVMYDTAIRIHCPSEEEAIALSEGRWDLANCATRLQLPSFFELYYKVEDRSVLYSGFSAIEAEREERLQLKEIRNLLNRIEGM